MAGKKNPAVVAQQLLGAAGETLSHESCILRRHLNVCNIGEGVTSPFCETIKEEQLVNQVEWSGTTTSLMTQN